MAVLRENPLALDAVEGLLLINGSASELTAFFQRRGSDWAANIGVLITAFRHAQRTGLSCNEEIRALYGLAHNNTSLGPSILSHYEAEQAVHNLDFGRAQVLFKMGSSPLPLDHAAFLYYSQANEYDLLSLCQQVAQSSHLSSPPLLGLNFSHYCFSFSFSYFGMDQVVMRCGLVWPTMRCSRKTLLERFYMVTKPKSASIQ